jgi:GNAT superfamily N-acetyltransferase
MNLANTAVAAVRRLQKSEAGAAVYALTGSFAHYDLYNYFFGDADVAHPVQMTALMEGLVQLSLDCAHVYCGNVPQDGVVIALPPEVFDIPLHKMLPVAIRKLRRTGLTYLWRILSISDELNHKRPKQPHWYVLLLGVAPSAQKRGLGRSLMQHIMGQAAASGAPVYLETTAAKNLQFYRELGFALRSQFRCHRGKGPETWSMCRE